MSQDEIGKQRDKRISDPNSADTRLGGENSEKNRKKNSTKLKKPLAGIIFSQNGMRQDGTGRETERRILDPNSAHTRPEGENSEKNSKKIQQN